MPTKEWVDDTLVITGTMPDGGEFTLTLMENNGYLEIGDRTGESVLCPLPWTQYLIDAIYELKLEAVTNG